MATLASLLVVMGMDTTALQAGSVKAQGALTGLGVSAKTLGSVVPLAAGAAAIGVAKFAADSVSAASDLEESLNKVRVVFEDSSGEIIEWSETTAQSFGISQQAALETAGTFGNLFDAMGLAEDAGVEMSMTLVELAADLASFNNASPEEVLEAMKSGLVGMIRPLREYGIEISEAALKEEALAQGITKSVEQMTQAEKVQLRYALILKQTGNAQGDFARTSDELANQQRILAAQWEDIQAAVGQLLLPAVLDIVSAFNDLATVILFLTGAIPNFNEKVKEATTSLIGFELGIADFFLDLTGGIPIIGDLVDTTRDVAGAMGEANDASHLTEAQLAELATAIETGNPSFLAMRDTWVDIAQEFLGIPDTVAAVESSTEDLTEAIRDQRLAVLALENSFLGIIDSANALHEAQRELNRLERLGKEDTKAYEQAVLDALEAQLGLEDSVLSYAKELIDAGKNQREVEQAIRDAAEAAGINKGEVNELIDAIRDYIREIGKIPEQVTTNVTTIFRQQGDFPSRVPRLAAGGIVTRSTMAVVGEAGPEAIIPLDKAGMGGVTVIINGDVTGEEIVKKVRDGLLKVGNRNAGTGLN
jgi:hypothetical protein